MSFLGFTSTKLRSVLPKDTPMKKNPEDPVRFEPKTPGLRVKHFSTEPPFYHVKGPAYLLIQQVGSTTWIL